MPIQDKIIEQAITFDDVLLVPAYSEVLPSQVSLQSRLTDKITLNVPIVSAAMDTVTEAEMAIAIARVGGLGFIHKNMTIEEQAAQVNKVKRSENGMISDPVTLSKNHTLGEAKETMERYKISGPISELTAFDVLDICQAVYDKHGSLMATGVKTKIAQVLDFALARRLVMQNVARNLVNTHKKHKKGNNPAITDPAQFAQFLYAINQASDCGFVVKSYLQIAPYVFVRPQELAQMHVSDIDFEQKQWRYTPTKTENSTQTALIVPLSDQVITKIYDLLAFHNQGYVFYSNRGKRPHIERARANEWLRKNGYQGVQSLHGLRATARTMLEEILDYPPHIIEMQLGHQVKDMNGTAYNRTKFIQKRTQMMNEWACYLDKLLGGYFKIMVG